MKRVKNLAIIILMITTLIILTKEVKATTGTINSETVRLRKEPNTKSTILEQLDKGDKVEILEQSEGWYKVTATVDGEKINGYISETLIDAEKEEIPETTTDEEPITEEPTTEPETNNEEVTEPEENNTDVIPQEPVVDTSTNVEENQEYTLQQVVVLKALPLMNSIEKSQINDGNVKITEIINDWCKIENDIQSGWIRINTLKKSITTTVQEQPVETPPVQEETAETQPEEEQEPSNQEETNTTEETIIKTAYVSSDGLRVRKEANTSSEVIDSLAKNTKVSIIEELDGWYKIKLSNKTGYVSSQYISDTKVAETTSRGGNVSRTENQEQPEQEEVKTEETKQEEPVQSEPTGTSGASVVEYAKQYLNYKYVSGGASPSTGFDCSGFTSYVYKQFGVSLYRTSKDQIKNGTAVEKADLQLGDLVIFNGDSNKTIGHVGIYIGDGNFIHASNPSDGVKITPLSTSYYSSRYVGARRVI